MAGKKIKVTGHARLRMARRGVTDSMVRETIEAPQVTGFADLGRPMAMRAYDRGQLKVVYSDEPDRYLVITVFWD